MTRTKHFSIFQSGILKPLDNFDAEDGPSSEAAAFGMRRGWELAGRGEGPFWSVRSELFAFSDGDGDDKVCYVPCAIVEAVRVIHRAGMTAGLSEASAILPEMGFSSDHLATQVLRPYFEAQGVGSYTWDAVMGLWREVEQEMSAKAAEKAQLVAQAQRQLAPPRPLRADPYTAFHPVGVYWLELSVRDEVEALMDRGDPQVVQAIKLVRERLKCGLKEAMDTVNFYFPRASD